MHREFEELGVSVGGIEYGHFTGEVQFDETGAPVIIDVERSGFGGGRLKIRYRGACTGTGKASSQARHRVP